MAATERRRVSNRIVTARFESAKMLKEYQHRTASNIKLSLKMEGHDHGTTKKVIQCQHRQRSDTQAV